MITGSTIVSRRGALALGLTAVVALCGVSLPAQAAEIRVGDLGFEVPEDVVPADRADRLGHHWQWQGRTQDNQARPRGVVLARADLATDDPVEVLGLLLASTAAGLLPDLRLSGRRSRTPPGGDEQTRVGISYAITQDHRYGGELAICPRSGGTTGVVVALTDGTLSTSFATGILDSIRWRS